MSVQERNARRREKNAAAGLKQFIVWLPEKQHPEFRALVQMLKENPNLSVVSVSCQDSKTGRMKGVKLR